ncbi:hypothetical protein [Vibrio parahaemolyticus]|uniref:hypothetical protein n=1 Tax=Vibrio parahaemolyticus TaxID=670 RepID=UPI00226B09EB|nr:hypothetical protein [Vibrio parahaemolyticus]MCX8941234.1 hypothetical protein [Vibrio parahaemolyticus]
MIHLMQLIGIHPPSEYEFAQIRENGEQAKRNWIESKQRYNQNLPSPHSQKFSQNVTHSHDIWNGQNEAQMMQENHPTNQMRHAVATMGKMGL